MDPYRQAADRTQKKHWLCRLGIHKYVTLHEARLPNAMSWVFEHTKDCVRCPRRVKLVWGDGMVFEKKVVEE